MFDAVPEHGDVHTFIGLRKSQCAAKGIYGSMGHYARHDRPFNRQLVASTPVDVHVRCGEYFGGRIAGLTPHRVSVRPTYPVSKPLFYAHTEWPIRSVPLLQAEPRVSLSCSLCRDGCVAVLAGISVLPVAYEGQL
jgi:hypothetical protein